MKLMLDILSYLSLINNLSLITKLMPEYCQKGQLWTLNTLL